MAVPWLYAEVVSGDEDAILVRTVLDEDRAELVAALRDAPEGTIDVACWLRAKLTASGNGALSLHCRCGATAFDLAFQFERGQPDGQQPFDALRSGVRAPSVAVEVGYEPTTGAVGSERVHLTSLKLVGTAEAVSTLAQLF